MWHRTSSRPPLTAFLLFYLTDIVGIGAAVAGSILLFGQLLNGVTDLVIGYLIDKTDTRWGQGSSVGPRHRGAHGGPVRHGLLGAGVARGHREDRLGRRLLRGCRRGVLHRLDPTVLVARTAHDHVQIEFFADRVGPQEI